MHLISNHKYQLMIPERNRKLWWVHEKT